SELVPLQATFARHGGHGTHADLHRALPVDPGAASALTGTNPGGPHSAPRGSVTFGQAPGNWAPGRVHPRLGAHPCYGPDNAAHTTPVKSPGKKLPLWEIKLVNSRIGTPSGLWSTTTASNTSLPVNITPGPSMSCRPVMRTTAGVPTAPP